MIFLCQNLYLFVLITLIQKFYETTDHVMLCYVYTTRKLSIEEPKRSHSGAQGPITQIWDPPKISETTGARMLKLKTQLDIVKYSLWVKKFIC